MKAFDELRALARRIRDNATESARAEYERTMLDIAPLELRLAPPTKIERPRNNRTKTLIDLIVDCLPHDREFEINQCARWMAQGSRPYPLAQR